MKKTLIAFAALAMAAASFAVSAAPPGLQSPQSVSVSLEVKPFASTLKKHAAAPNSFCTAGAATIGLAQAAPQAFAGASPLSPHVLAAAGAQSPPQMVHAFLKYVPAKSALQRS